MNATKHTPRWVQEQAADSARRAAEKCEAAGNHANAAMFRRIAEEHAKIARGQS